MADKFFGWHTVYGVEGEHDTPYLTRIWLGRLRLHVFHRGDADPDCHNHPWDFWTFPLTPYVEEVATRALLGHYEITRQVVKSFRWHYRPATHTHRVIGSYAGKAFDRDVGELSELITDDRKIVTLVWTGPARQSWGFLKNRDGKWCWTGFREYIWGGGKHAPCEPAQKPQPGEIVAVSDIATARVEIPIDWEPTREAGYRASLPGAHPSAPSPQSHVHQDLEAALDAFWYAAHEQGRDGRDHDDEEGTAQKAEDDLRRVIAVLSAPAPENNMTVPFNALCYGARFRYADQTKVWVKIGHDLIAEWDASKVADKWIGQTVCSFSENGDVSEAVQLVLEPSPQPNLMGIETAPKDGTWFIAYQNGEPFPCDWRAEEQDEGPPREGWFDFFNRSFEEPTHWTPVMGATPETSSNPAPASREAGDANQP